MKNIPLQIKEFDLFANKFNLNYFQRKIMEEIMTMHNDDIFNSIEKCIKYLKLYEEIVRTDQQTKTDREQVRLLGDYIAAINNK